MKHLIFLGLALCAAGSAVAEPRKPLTLTVTPRSFLDAGKVAPVGSLNRYATDGARSYQSNPPWGNLDRYGQHLLPDPVQGTFIGARSAFDPIP